MRIARTFEGRGPCCLLLVLCLVFLFSGCAREVSWINLEPKTVELKEMGETFQITIVGLDKENKPVEEAVFTCESSNTGVATVENSGLITAKGSGNTVISVIAENGEKAVVQCKVAITDAIVIKPTELTLKVGETYELEAKVVDEKGGPAENQMVNWASSDLSVAMIDDFGQVTARAPGEATMTGTQINVYGRVMVRVEPAE